MRLPSAIVPIACHQFMPPAMSPLASMYVGMQTDMPIQRAAMLYVPHVRCATVVGAMSAFTRELCSSSATSISTGSEKNEPLMNDLSLFVGEFGRSGRSGLGAP